MSPFQHSSSSGTLAQLAPGFPAAVLDVRPQAGPLCLRLQELGFVPGAPLEVLSREGGVVVRVGEQKLCLGQDLAAQVQVVAL